MGQASTIFNFNIHRKLPTTLQLKQWGMRRNSSSVADRVDWPNEPDDEKQT